jgi:outer membrane protein assembly factor BamD
MKKKAIFQGLLALVLLFVFSGCGIMGWFGKKKNTDAPPDTLAQRGIKELSNKNYIDAIDTFEKLKNRYPYSDQALLAQIMVADAKFYDKKYQEAFESYREFEKLHPTNKAVPYCIFQEGRCFYLQRSTIDRDQTYTRNAIREFTRLKQKYPKSHYIPRADKYLARCRRDLAEHEFYVGNFYFTTEHYKAALDRYEGLIQDYPEFSKNGEARQRIQECKKLLADKNKPKGWLSALTSIFDAKW